MLSALVLDLLLSNAPKAVVPKDDYIHSDNLVALNFMSKDKNSWT